MSITLSTFLTQLMNMVPQSDTELTAITRNQKIKQAVTDYSRDRPDQITDDVSGDGGKYYLLDGSSAVVSGWSDTFSQIVAIQYPAPTIASDETPVYLEPDDWDTSYHDASNRYLWLPNHAPAATETMRITYTAAYVWSAGSITKSVAQSSHGFSLNDYVYQNEDGAWVDAGGGSGALLATHQATTITDTNNFVATELAVSIPQMDFFAVCNRAACLACQAIAERYSRTSDSSITADSVNHTSRAQEFRNQAREFCRLYNDHLGIMSDADGNSTTGSPMADFVDLDTSPLWPTGREFIFHNRHTR